MCLPAPEQMTALLTCCTVESNCSTGSLKAGFRLQELTVPFLQYLGFEATPWFTYPYHDWIISAMDTIGTLLWFLVFRFFLIVVSCLMQSCPYKEFTASYTLCPHITRLSNVLGHSVLGHRGESLIRNQLLYRNFGIMYPKSTGYIEVHCFH